MKKYRKCPALIYFVSAGIPTYAAMKTGFYDVMRHEDADLRMTCAGALRN